MLAILSKIPKCIEWYYLGGRNLVLSFFIDWWLWTLTATTKTSKPGQANYTIEFIFAQVHKKLCIWRTILCDWKDRSTQWCIISFPSVSRMISIATNSLLSKTFESDILLWEFYKLNENTSSWILDPSDGWQKKVCTCVNTESR